MVMLQFFIRNFIFLAEFTEERKLSIIISSVLINVDDVLMPFSLAFIAKSLS